MLMKDINDSKTSLENIADAVRKIRPDEVHINLPTRPPAETWVKPSNEENLMRAVAVFGDIAKVVHPVEGTFDLSGYSSLVDAIIGIITRHPMRQEELMRTLAQWAPGEVNDALNLLASSGQAQIVERFGAKFWGAAGSRYPDEAHSLAAVPRG
jgi:wyosine [tRNA(Phe)-imidazoG37] synthetase (radical SAM superfamily)